MSPRGPPRLWAHATKYLRIGKEVHSDLRNGGMGAQGLGCLLVAIAFFVSFPRVGELD
jgi:hypothetical protein